MGYFSDKPFALAPTPRKYNIEQNLQHPAGIDLIPLVADNFTKLWGFGGTPTSGGPLSGSTLPEERSRYFGRDINS